MNNIFQFIVFITIVSVIYFGLHFLVYQYLSRSLELSEVVRWRFKLALWVCGLLFYAHMFLSREAGIHILAFPAYTWMGIVSIAFTCCVAGMAAGALFPAFKQKIGWTAAGLAVVIGAISLINGLSAPRVREVTVRIPNLPPQLAGFTIVQLSDVHMEAYKPKRCVTRTMARVNGLKPDLAVITGDLIDGDICLDPELCAALRSLSPRYGVYAVVGNHECYTGLAHFRELGRRSGFKILENANVTLENGLQLAGLEDREQKRFNGSGPDHGKAFAGLDPQKPTIVLSHRPEQAEKSWERGASLILSGHTHAGQIPPMDLLVSLVYQYPSGLYEHDGRYIYTTPGTGYWGPPMRFLSRSEIVFIRLIPR